MIAATTENPSFRVNNALLSRCRVFLLEKLKQSDIIEILQRAIKIQNVDDISVEILTLIASMCDGDARIAINSLEMVLSDPSQSFESVKQSLLKSHLSYDKNGEEHYNAISALHKSIRGSDDNASLYWFGRMLYAGEDPLYIARRLIRIASEDIGIANNEALTLAMSTYQACQVLGMPESDVILAHCVTFLARSPKSVECYKGIQICLFSYEKSQANNRGGRNLSRSITPAKCSHKTHGKYELFQRIQI